MHISDVPTAVPTARVQAEHTHVPARTGADADALLQDLQRARARQDALRLAQDVARTLVLPAGGAQGHTAWRELQGALDRLRATTLALSSSPLFDGHGAANLPFELTASLREVQPAQLASTIPARCNALMHRIVQAASSPDVRGFQRATEELLFLQACGSAIDRLVVQIEAMAGTPAHFAKPGWFGRQPPGTYPTEARDGMRLLITQLMRVRATLDNPRGAVQQLMAFVRAVQDHPEDIAAIVRKQVASKSPA